MPDETVPSERLTEYVAPLSTTDPSGDLSELEPLAERFADATVVGLGEATHGTREFFQLKHRVLRLLVEEHGFRLFAFESNFSETLALNDYVLHGEGDPEEGLDGIYFWTWNTEEVLAMVEWLREFNEDRPLDDRVRFYGYDAQFGQGPARALREFLADADPAFLEDLGDDIDALADEGVLQDQRDVDTDDLEFAERVVDDLGTWFADHEDGAVDAEAAVSPALARQHFRTLEQAVERQRAMHDGEGFADAAAVRDEHMAENVAWIREYEDADRIALWAHNSHVFRGETVDDGPPFESMGSHLDDRFGDEYAVVGFDFERGSFRAVAHPEHYDDPGVETWTVDPLREEVLGSGEAETDADAANGDATGADQPERPAIEFHEAVDELEADGEALFVDVAAARDDDAVGPWLDRPHLCHGIGAMFHEGDHSEYCGRYRLAREADALLFVPETTAARAVGADD